MSRASMSAEEVRSVEEILATRSELDAAIESFRAACWRRNGKATSWAEDVVMAATKKHLAAVAAPIDAAYAKQGL